MGNTVYTSKPIKFKKIRFEYHTEKKIKTTNVKTANKDLKIIIKKKYKWIINKTLFFVLLMALMTAITENVHPLWNSYQSL